MAGDSEGRTPGGDQRPVPDPTSLTTEQLHREIAGLERVLVKQLEGMEKVLDERFDKVRQQFDLVERQRVEQKADTQKAVDAALSAQKEAVKQQTIASERAIAKSEAATTKQLEQLGATFKSDLGGINNTLGDVKTRVERFESVKAGGTQAYAGLYALAVLVGVILSALVAVGVFKK